MYSAKQMFCLYGVLTIDYEQSEQRGFGDIQYKSKASVLISKIKRFGFASKISNYRQINAL